MAVLLFAAFWALLGVAIVFIAINGGARGARDRLQSQSRGGRRGAGVVFAVVIVGFGVVIPLALLTGNDANASKQVAGVRLASADRQGREIFRLRCGTCHTLQAARTTGPVGPNLDQLLGSNLDQVPKREAFVLDAVNHGRQRGNGTMPARIVTGSDASAVASFVAKVAGH
jgi:mono/diheme cytochrome c family protein